MSLPNIGLIQDFTVMDFVVNIVLLLGVGLTVNLAGLIIIFCNKKANFKTLETRTDF